MKKKILLILGVFLILLFSGCIDQQVTTVDDSTETDDFIEIEEKTESEPEPPKTININLEHQIPKTGTISGKPFVDIINTEKTQSGLFVVSFSSRRYNVTTGRHQWTKYDNVSKYLAPGETYRFISNNLFTTKESTSNDGDSGLAGSISVVYAWNYKVILPTKAVDFRNDQEPGSTVPFRYSVVSSGEHSRTPFVEIINLDVHSGEFKIIFMSDQCDLSIEQHDFRNCSPCISRVDSGETYRFTPNEVFLIPEGWDGITVTVGEPDPEELDDYWYYEIISPMKTK